MAEAYHLEALKKQHSLRRRYFCKSAKPVSQVDKGVLKDLLKKVGISMICVPRSVLIIEYSILATKSSRIDWEENPYC